MVVSRFILPAIGVLRGVDMYEQHSQRWKELCAEAPVELNNERNGPHTIRFLRRSTSTNPADVVGARGVSGSLIVRFHAQSSALQGRWFLALYSGAFHTAI